MSARFASLFIGNSANEAEWQGDGWRPISGVKVA